MSTEEEDTIEQVSSARRERLRALRAANEYHSMPDEPLTENESKDYGSVDNNTEVVEEDVIEKAAVARRDRLKALKMAKDLLQTTEGEEVQNGNRTEESEETEEDKKLNMKFRNYLPHDKQLQEGKLAPVDLPKFEDSVAVAPLQPEKIEDPFVNIAPKKPNWDLQRDVQKKLDKLERRTQKAIYELMQEQEREKEAMELANAMSEDRLSD